MIGRFYWVAHFGSKMLCINAEVLLYAVDIFLLFKHASITQLMFPQEFDNLCLGLVKGANKYFEWLAEYIVLGSVVFVVVF